jgi:hypothetical protein
MHEILVEELHRRPRSIVVVARGVAWLAWGRGGEEE